MPSAFKELYHSGNIAYTNSLQIVKIGNKSSLMEEMIMLRSHKSWFLYNYGQMLNSIVL